MRDVKLYFTDSQGFDINIEDGYPELMDYENQTQDQRASIGALFSQGTLPGNLDFGVNWDQLYSKDSSLVDIDNEVKQCVNTVAGGDGTFGNTYMPLYVPAEDGSVKVTVMKGFV